MSSKEMKQHLSYVFVHGLSGWGSYDEQYQKMPYWGMRSGDLMAFLQGQGFSCFAASVAPTGSAWDRVCELYAQLAGKRVDYGAVHSQKYGHERFGKDFTGRPLLPYWGSETRLVLLGHSFGGVTVRLFSELLANGDPEEKASGTEDLSTFFAGGMGSRLHSIVTLAAPTNGTTAYNLFLDPSFHPEQVPVPFWSRPLASMLARGTKAQKDGRDERDYAGYDMHIDHAMALNRRISTIPDVYYFAVPCGFTEVQKDGTHRPKKGMEPLFAMRSCQMGAYSGKTEAGMVIDESWRENDGLVNTVSAMAPIGAPSTGLDETRIHPGIWNVFPVYDGDHMALQGGLMRKHDIRSFYLKLLQMVDALA